MAADSPPLHTEAPLSVLLELLSVTLHPVLENSSSVCAATVTAPLERRELTTHSSHPFQLASLATADTHHAIARHLWAYRSIT
ncbi:hypothetical protein AAFF_G00402280 [Aldrovandia affinis]|uniref:Uncharacterized protein n=1 Tax=Aldrovandia affinis TaxID=143900 RepID=A0AAD7T8Q5_9TELE|nr:hypothetical protein AAFF_G00402280 [Aldrovandia affinis]